MLQTHLLFSILFLTMCYKSWIGECSNRLQKRHSEIAGSGMTAILKFSYSIYKLCIDIKTQQLGVID